MHAKHVVRNVVRDLSDGMHERRRTAVEAAVWAAITGQDLTVTGLGRAMESAAQEKHCIKRADRLLSNAHLYRERDLLYGGMVRRLIGAQQHPVLLIDWSDLDATKTFQVLRVSLAVAGRAVTLYEEVHGKATAGSRVAQRHFLAALHALLPDTCQPVLVTDAGFRTPWFQAVEALGWYWVARIRHRHYVQQTVDGPWVLVTALHAQATATPRSLGEVRLTQGAPHPCRLVLFKGKPKGRHCLTTVGTRTRSAYSEKHARRGREPWLLATNLPASHTFAKKVVRLYRARMQIEEGFRDVKSTRFGLGLERHRTSQLERLAVLLLIAALALLVLWLVGTAARARGYARQYQVNTRHRTPELSVIFLGLRLCQRRCDTVTADDIQTARQMIATLNRHYGEILHDTQTT